jgi:hypothetical protein
LSTPLLLDYEDSCPLCVRFRTRPETLNQLSADLLLCRRRSRRLAWEYRTLPEGGERIVRFAELRYHRGHIGTFGFPEDYFVDPALYESGDARRRNVKFIEVVLQKADDREQKRRALDIADRMYCFAWTHFALSLDRTPDLSDSCLMQVAAGYFFEQALKVAREAGAGDEARRLGFEKFPVLSSKSPQRRSSTRRAR